MLKRLVMVAALTWAAVGQVALASMNDVVIVQSDDALKTAGTTRDEYNRKNPAAENKWREAWAAESTKKDTRELAGIRKRTSKPKDPNQTASIAPPTAAKGQ